MNGLPRMSLMNLLRCALAGMLVAAPLLAAAQCTDAILATDRLQSTAQFQDLRTAIGCCAAPTSTARKETSP